jgi:hypothetical protein
LRPRTATAFLAGATAVFAWANFCRGWGLLTGGATGRLALCAEIAFFNCATAGLNRSVGSDSCLNGCRMPLIPGDFFSDEFIAKAQVYFLGKQVNLLGLTLSVLVTMLGSPCRFDGLE